MKTSSTGHFILAIIWVFVSLVWFFYIKSVVGGVIWLIAGIIMAGAACIKKKKEQK